MITSRIENIFVSNAKNTFGVKKNFRQINNHRHKQWFTFECKTARNRYHSTRKKYNKYKTPYYKNMLKTVSKEYKNMIAQSLKKFKNNRINQLKPLKTSNPREFWKIINSVDKSKETKPPLKDLYTYFKSLNSSPDDNIEYSESHQNTNDTMLHRDDLAAINEEINQPINAQEILSAVKMLKITKAQALILFLMNTLKTQYIFYYQFI